MRNLILLSLLLITTNLPAQTFPDSDTEEMFQEAQKLLKSEDHDKATRLYKKIYKRYPDQINSRVHLMTAYSLEKKWKEIRELNFNPEDFPDSLYKCLIYYGTGKAYLEDENIEKGKSNLEKSLKYAGSRIPQIRLDLGDIEYGENNWAPAKQFFEEYLGNITHYEPNVGVKITYCNLMLDDYSGMFFHLEKIDKYVKEPNAWLHFLWSKAYYYTQQFQAALDHGLKAVKKRPDDPYFLEQLGWSYKENLDYEGATETFEQCLKHIDQPTPGMLNGTVWSYIGLRNWEKAEFHLKKMEELYPKNYLTLEKRAVLYERSDRFEKAIPLLKLVISLDSSNASRYMDLGRAYKHFYGLDTAIHFLTKYRDYAVESEHYYGNLGFYYAEVGDPEKAILYIDSTITRKGEHAFFFSNRGNAYRQLKNYEAAEADFGKSMLLDPQNSYLWYNIARLHIDTGEVERACEALEKALELGFQDMYGDAVKTLRKEHCR